MGVMFLAVLHVSFETPTALERKAAWEARGLSVFHIMPTQAPHTAAREFPPEVVVVELGERPDFGLQAVRSILAVPRRRGDRWPLVLAEVRPESRNAASDVAPHAVLMPPGASPDEVLDACLGALNLNRSDWASGAGKEVAASAVTEIMTASLPSQGGSPS